MSNAILFSPFRLDLRRGRLSRGDAAVAVRPKTFAVLVYLAQHRGELVSKDELLDAVWKDISVTDDMPRICVRELRRALGDDSRDPEYIETVRGRGYRFIGEEYAVSSETVLAGSEATALVGRGAELESLRSLRRDAAAGRSRIALLTGEAGIGKTTLLHAALDEFSAEEGDTNLVGLGQCIQHRGEEEPYRPLMDVIAGWCHGSLQETVTDALRRCAPTWCRELPWLERVSLDDKVPSVNSDRMVREFCSLVEELSHSSTVVLVLEDLQWADAATLHLLRVLAEHREPARMLLLATVRTRDGEVADHPAVWLREELVREKLCCEFPLEPFDETLVRRLLTQRFDSVVARLLAPIVQARTGGNPSFVRAVSECLVDEGLVKQVGGVWKLGRVCAVVAAATQEGSERHATSAMQQGKLRP